MSENTIPAVEKTLELIALIGNSPVPLSRKVLEEKLGLSSSTCYRILCTLQEADWIRKLPEGTFILSAGLVSATRNLFELTAKYERMQEYLDRLSAETGLSSKFSIRRGDYQITLLRGESDSRIQISGKIGADFPLIEGSVGAALLSGESEENLEHLIRRCPEKIEERRNPELVRSRIRALKKEGVALNITPNRWHVHAMSAPVRGKDGGTEAALTLLGWEGDFEGPHLAELRTVLLKYAELCARRLSI